MPAKTRWQDVNIPKLLRFARLNLKRGIEQPWLVFGAPGMGKTQVAKTEYRKLVAEHHGVPVEKVCVIEFSCNGRDEVEATGPALPKKDEDGCVYFSFADKTPIHVLIDRALEMTGADYYILILDELAQGTQGLIKTLRSVLNPQDHSLGGNKLRPGGHIFATANRVEDRAGSFALPKHVPNVCKVVNLVFSMRALETYWSEHNLNPLAIECARAFHQDGFFDESVPVEDRSSCTPRSLENVSYDMDVVMAEPEFDGTFSVEDRDYFTTVIGRGAADTLVNFCNQHDKIPSADEILSNPQAAMVPKELGYQSIAAHRAMAAANDEHAANAAFTYIRRLRTELMVPVLTKLIAQFNREGYTFESTEALDFMEQYRDLLPLTWS